MLEFIVPTQVRIDLNEMKERRVEGASIGDNLRKMGLGDIKGEVSFPSHNGLLD